MNVSTSSPSFCSLATRSTRSAPEQHREVVPDRLGDGRQDAHDMAPDARPDRLKTEGIARPLDPGSFIEGSEEWDREHGAHLNVSGLSPTGVSGDT